MRDDADDSFPFRLVVTDLDGTLLGPRKEISAENLSAVRRMQRAGARITVASGRRHQNSVRFYRQLGLDGPLISCAGALIKDPDSGVVLRERPLTPEMAAKLVSEGQRRGYTIIYYHRDHLYVSARNHWTKLYESRVNETAELYPGNLDDLRGEAALKIVWYGEPAQIQADRNNVEQQYGAAASVVATDPENLEFLDRSANKAEALSAVAKYYGVDLPATMAIGDGENDAPMLAVAGLGVAVDGANDTAKAVAGLVGENGPPETRFARAIGQVFARFAHESSFHA